MFKKLCVDRSTACAGWTALVLRVVVGVVFFVHGGQKLLGWFDGSGIAGTVGFLQQLGFGGAVFWAWVLALTEFLGGLALIMGLLTRVAASLLAIVMVVALFTVHVQNGFFVGKGGTEYALVLLAATVALILSGAGQWGLDAKLCCKGSVSSTN